MKNFLVLMTFVGFLLTACSEGKQTESITTTSGFEMVWHERGQGEVPNEGDFLFFHVSYMVGDSVLFDTRSRPDTPSLQMPAMDDPQILGEPLFEALALMVPGDLATVSQRGDQMPLDQSQQLEIGPDDVLDFNIELFRITTQQEIMAMQEATKVRESEVKEFVEEVLRTYRSKGFGDDLIVTESGLQYVIHEKGNGPEINPGDQAEVHYFGKIIQSGIMFDNSFSRGEPFSVTVGVGMVIPGWDEALSLMNKGDIATVFIPYPLAYGEAGRPPQIPERSDLLFYVEIKE
jgi:FKBP-type peptidyl-prolyl cis-trans isomerase FkpA